MFGTLEEEAFDQEDEDRPELFSMMQNLLHFDEPSSSSESTGTPFGPPPTSPPGSTNATGAGGGTGPSAGGAPGIAGVPAGGGMTGGGATFIGEGGQVVPPDMVAVPASMVPSLLQEGIDGAAVSSAGGPAQAMQPFQPQEGQTVQMVDQAKLMEILSSIQEKLNTSTSSEAIPNSM